MTGSKYEPLGRHLASVRFNEWRTSFSEIEEILGFALPRSARKHRAWWANDVRQTQPLAWLNVGWRTDQVDFGAGRVVFRRDVNLPRTDRGERSSAASTLEEPTLAVAVDRPNLLQADPIKLQERRPSTAEADAESVDRPTAPQSPPEPMRVSRYAFGFQWKALGSVALDGDGQLMFPYQPPIPAVYRLELRRGEHQRCYIGETDNLQRRFAHYRKPGPTQDTNIRLNAELLAALGAGDEIAVVCRD